MPEIHYPPKFTQADRGHLLRAIGRTFPIPRSVAMQPEFGAALLRFDDDDTDAVDEWAKITGATVTHDTITHRTAPVGREWHSYGTRHNDGSRGYHVGWALDLWCVVTGPAPAVVEGDAAGGAALPGPAADGPPDAAGPGPTVPPPVQALEAE